MKKETKKNLIYSVIGSLVVTTIMGLGVFQAPDKWLQDTLYQKPGSPSGDIIIIGIDDKALSQLGQYYTWDRNIMASALEALASDPDKRPAVVAVDTLYTSTTDPEADQRLADAAEELGNVVIATAATFGTKQEFGDGTASIDRYAILDYETPYEKLASVTTQGHINAMYDTDGIMRHALLYIEPEQDERVYSMAYQTASIYLKSKGRAPEMPYINSRGHFYVSFTASPESYYDGISLADLIAGEIPADYYDGKIVLIGPYALGLQDSYFTPIARASQMYGIEFQANVIQNIIDGDYKQEMAAFPQLAIMFIVCAGALYLFLRNRFSISLVLLVLFTAAELAEAKLLYTLGSVTHPLWATGGTVILFVSAVVGHYLRAAMERQQVTKTFERYVAPEIVREILKEGTEKLSLGGKTCNIAVLFVDVRGFTTMSERLAPETVVQILNRYLTMVNKAVVDNSGTLDKFVGDAAMAFWGAPLPQEDSIYLASKTALEIIEGVEKVSAELKEEIGEEIHVGVGVHYGPAVVGNMGSEQHMDYTAIGDTVNTSARLEANAPAGTVYISRIVADHLGDRASFTSLGNSIKLKGKADGFEVLTLDSLEGR